MSFVSKIFGHVPPDPNDIHIGDVVELVTGGPLMTVGRFDDTGGGGACCQWFEGGEYREAWFYPSALVKRERQLR